MQHNIFVTGTGTDIGKTYVTALLIKKLVQEGVSAAYFKAAVSGAPSIEESDAGFVIKKAGLNQDLQSSLCYLYEEPLSPHLAARLNNLYPDLSFIKERFNALCKSHSCVVMEGSGGIICPICHEDGNKILLEDIIKELDLPCVIIAHAGLGTINHAVLTLHYLKSKNICCKGVILNYFDKESLMHQDNLKMIEELGKTKVLAVCPEGFDELVLRVPSLSLALS